MNEFKKIYKPVIDQPIKVAMFSNGPELPTGYAKILREISTRLSLDPAFEVSIINETSFYKPPYNWMGMPVYSLEVPLNNNQPVREIHTAASVMKICEHIRPDILWILEDSFTLHNLGFTGIVSTPFKRVFYIPLDGFGIPSIGVNPIRSMDKLVSMAKFTQDSLEKEGFVSDMIWHGVNIELFSPVTDNQQKALKKKYGFEEDDFIIYNYGRNNNLRKANQSLMWVLAKYLESAPSNHKAFLHILDPANDGNDLIDYRDRILSLEFDESILNRIIFSSFDVNKPATDFEVSEMIQLSDVVISASTGEGFGLIMAEAMACAKPVVHHEYSTPYELLIDESLGVGPRGWVVPTGATNTSSLNVEHGFVNKEAFVTILQQVVNSPEEMKQRGLNGRLFAEKYLNWAYLVDEWKKIFREVI